MTLLKIFSLSLLLGAVLAGCGAAPVDCPAEFADNGQGACVKISGTSGQNTCFYDSCP